MMLISMQNVIYVTHAKKHLEAVWGLAFSSTVSDAKPVSRQSSPTLAPPPLDPVRMEDDDPVDFDSDEIDLFRCSVCGNLAFDDRLEELPPEPITLQKLQAFAEDGCSTCLLLYDGIERCVPKIKGAFRYLVKWSTHKDGLLIV